MGVERGVMSERENLKRICYEIYEAACRCIDKPKNRAKGDNWRQEHLDNLQHDTHVEVREVYGEAHQKNPQSMVDEAGDVLAFLAMAIDKVRRMVG